MANITPPGVQNFESDRSFRTVSSTPAGACVIGPTTSGPAFIPTTISNYADYTKIFGAETINTYVPFTVREYLNSAGSIIVMRILTSEPWVNTGYAISISPIVSGSYATATIANSINWTGSIDTLYATVFSNINGMTTYLLYSGYDAARYYPQYSYAVINYGTLATLVTSINSVSSSIGIQASIASNVISFSGSVAGTIGNGSTINEFSTYYGSLSTLAGGTNGAAGAAKYTVAYLIPSTNGATTGLTGSAWALQAATIPNTVVGASFAISSSLGIITASFNNGDKNNIATLFSTNPNSTGTNAFNSVYYLYKYWGGFASANTGYSASIAAVNISFTGAAAAYQSGATPYVISQLDNSGNSLNLFRFVRFSHGMTTNTDIKVEIRDIKKSGTVPGTPYGTFTVVIRSASDSDQSQVVLETYPNCSLDPNSSSYILAQIGSKYQQVDANGNLILLGDYPNNSSYVYVQPYDSNLGSNAGYYPFGYASLNVPFNVSTTVAPNNVILQGTAAAYDSRTDFGFNYFDPDSLQYESAIDLNTQVAPNSSFNLSNMSSHPSSSVVGLNNITFSGSLQSAFAPVEMLKFVLPFQNGYNGRPFNKVINVGTAISPINTMGYDCSSATASGSLAYITAVNILSNAMEYDYNLLVTPGLVRTMHASAIDNAAAMCQNRGDVFYVYDAAQYGASEATVINAISGVDNNYCATYYPWVKVFNSALNKPQWVPTSVIVPAVFAKNDSIGYPWFAPAGLNRANLPMVSDTYTRLNSKSLGNLYSNRVNPIAHFANQGFVIWGQKTLQALPSALDRVNVRRLLINAKKFISSKALYLVWDNNTTQLRNSFLNIANPYFDNVKQKQGLYKYQVVCDDSNNTAKVIDNNQLVGTIYLQPAKTAEQILVTYNITPTGVTFGS